MNSGVYLFEGREAHGALDVDEELDVSRAFSAFLQLTTDVSCTKLGEYPFEELMRDLLWVIEGSEPVALSHGLFNYKRVCRICYGVTV